MTEVWELLTSTQGAASWVLSGLVLLGWQSLFIAAAVLGLVIYLILLVMSPVAWLAARGRKDSGTP